ncbi:MAG: RNA polymerase factor sigma-54 [Desulfovibrionales bacterium]|nr:RNA polymerase factor sigma-54 [Desulfovibrionales bacterium]
MGLELKQQLKLTQQLVMTPQLQQAIKMLQLSRLELLDSIYQELEANPVLEEGPEEDAEDSLAPSEETSNEEISVQDRVLPEVMDSQRAMEELNWEDYIDEYNTSSGGYSAYSFEEKESTSFEATLSRKPSLSSHLMWQFILSPCTEEEKIVGELIIGNLDADGYLNASLSEIAATAHVPEELVLEVLKKIQGLDPVGVAARDLKECLLIQTRHLGLEGTLVETIISNHIHQLEVKNYQAIAKETGASLADVIKAVEVITRLEPKPGRAYNGEETHYISPDIYVYKVGDEFVIVLNDEGLPRLRVSPFYRGILNQSSDGAAPAKDYIQGKLRSAVWLIRSIHQRQRTIYKVTESIVKFQREFLEKGIAYLKPLILKDVAEDVEMHESTVSRVTTNKYVHTPQGLLELKFFFNTGISCAHGEVMASEAVKDKIRRLVQSENSSHPYSDKEIANMLNKNDINIARRTIAKYREVMGILPSNQRKKFAQ